MMSENDPIRVMVVDDHDMVREGLAVLLRSFKDLTLIADAKTGKEAIRLIEQDEPDVVLMDLVMPGMDGVELTHEVRRRFPSVQIVALTSFKDENYVHDALQAGAIGYLLKDTTIDEIADAIRSAYAGRPTLAPEATQFLIEKATRTPPTPTFNLTERELEVLTLIAEGLTNRQIAEHLSVSRSTIKFHVSSLLAKMGVSSRTEATALAMQHRLVK